MSRQAKAGEAYSNQILLD